MHWEDICRYCIHTIINVHVPTNNAQNTEAKTDRIEGRSRQFPNNIWKFYTPLLVIELDSRLASI